MHRSRFTQIQQLVICQQTQKALDNLKVAIESARGTLEHIVMLRIYKVNYQKEDGKVISKLLKEKFERINPPTSTWLNVEGLAKEGFI